MSPVDVQNTPSTDSARRCGTDSLPCPGCCLTGCLASVSGQMGLEETRSSRDPCQLCRDGKGTPRGGGCGSRACLNKSRRETRQKKQRNNGSREESRNANSEIPSMRQRHEEAGKLHEFYSRYHPLNMYFQVIYRQLEAHWKY